MTEPKSIPVLNKIKALVTYLLPAVLLLLSVRIIHKLGVHPLITFIVLLFLFFALTIIPELEREPLNWQTAKTSIRFFVSSQILSALNPIILVQVIAQTLGQLIAYIRYGGTLPDAMTYQNKVSYRLPVEERCYVGNGGIDEKTSHSWHIIAQRFAYDFIIKNEKGKSYDGEGKSLTDYYIYGKPILAPADGIVVKVRDGVRDCPKVGKGTVDWKTLDFRGNFVIIKHAENEYSFLAHLKKGSICVKKGEHVKSGQKIGLCGNSGHSTEPHLHFHIQDRSNFYLSMGLPIRFAKIEINGVENTDEYISRDQYVKDIS